MFNMYNLEGKTLVSIKVSFSGESVYLCTTDGGVYRIHRKSWCSDAVRVERVTGNLSGLIGEPITDAIINRSPPNSTLCVWKEYEFRTKECKATIRWHVESINFLVEAVEMVKEDFMLHEGMNNMDIMDKMGIPLEDIPDILMMMLLMPEPKGE